MERRQSSGPVLLVTAGALMLLLGAAAGPSRAEPLIIDHTCTLVGQIPDQWIDAAQAQLRWHYAHTSHGEQLTVGLDRLMAANSRYRMALAYSSLPAASNALRIFDGQENETYITPDLYWQTSSGRQKTRDVLNHNPTINVSQWAWCTQPDYYTASEVQAYLNAMAAFENQFPGVRFVYMTSNAQATGQDGYRRSLRNALIRDWVKGQPAKNRVLYDFEDLDAWWYNRQSDAWERSTYAWSGRRVPVEHPSFHGDEAAHTTYSSCAQKGRAVWWMMARLAGWAADLNPGWNSVTLSNGGRRVEARLRVRNLGTDVARGFRVAVYLSNDGHTPGLRLKNFLVPQLGPSAAKVLELVYESSASLSGKYLLAMVDRQNQVYELNGNNNRASHLMP